MAVLLFWAQDRPPPNAPQWAPARPPGSLPQWALDLQRAFAGTVEAHDGVFVPMAATGIVEI
jgi:hypothetical protein